MPASVNYRVVEPHPSVSRPALHTARGGAGNIINLKNTKTTPSQTATGPPSLTRLDSHVPSVYKSGRGGAGNVHSSSERAIFSFDEELERDLRRAAPVYHVGRGGAGNMVYSDNGSTLSRKFSASSNATSSSTGSTSSTREKALRGLEKGWGKLRGMA